MPASLPEKALCVPASATPEMQALEVLSIPSLAGEFHLHTPALQTTGY